MILFRKLFFVSTLLLVSCLTFSQPKLTALTVGDKVPDIQFKNVLNYKAKTARLSDFKGKLVILDMWSTWCTTCIKAFPHMDSLQRKFGDKIQILLVNHYQQLDPEEKIKKTLQELKDRTGYYPSLPIPIHDTVLAAYFPNESVPHEVWIDANRKVVAITGHKAVNAANIQLALDGKLNLPVKNDFGFDPQLPLLVNGNGGYEGDFLFRSIFTGYNPAASGAGRHINEEGMVTGYYVMNHSLLNLIKAAYPRMLSVTKNRIIYEGVDPEKLNERYCYDLNVLPTPPAQFNDTQYLRSDLQQFFHVSAYPTKKMKSCFVVTAFNDKKSTAANKARSMDLDPPTIRKHLHGFAIREIIAYLDMYDKPIVDESGMSNVITDIDFPAHFDLSNQKALIDYLRSVGFEIKEEERILDVVVIRGKQE